MQRLRSRFDGDGLGGHVPADDQFSITQADGEGHVTLVLAGEFDLLAAPHLRDAVEGGLGSGGAVVLDLAGVTFLDSSALHTLVGATRLAQRAGSRLVLRNVPEAAMTVIELAGLEELLTIEP
jgi:anti-anti-sigma factor